MGKLVTGLLLAALVLLGGGAAEAKPKKKPPKLSAKLLDIGMDGATAAVARGAPNAEVFGEWYTYDLTQCRETKTRTTARGCDGDIAYTYWDDPVLVPGSVIYDVSCEFEVTVSTKKIRGGTNPVFTFTDAAGYGGAIDWGEKVRKIYTQRSTDIFCGAPVFDYIYRGQMER
jgi:hypothetical protein